MAKSINKKISSWWVDSHVEEQMLSSSITGNERAGRKRATLLLQAAKPPAGRGQRGRLTDPTLGQQPTHSHGGCCAVTWAWAPALKQNGEGRGVSTARSARALPQVTAPPRGHKANQEKGVLVLMPGVCGEYHSQYSSGTHVCSEVS